MPDGFVTPEVETVAWVDPYSDCKVDGCRRMAVGRGFCASHYHKYSQNGWLAILGDPPVKENKASAGVEKRAEAVISKLFTDMTLLAENRPDQFVDLVRALGFYASRR